MLVCNRRSFFGFVFCRGVSHKWSIPYLIHIDALHSWSFIKAKWLVTNALCTIDQCDASVWIEHTHTLMCRLRGKRKQAEKQITQMFTVGDRIRCFREWNDAHIIKHTSKEKKYIYSNSRWVFVLLRMKFCGFFFNYLFLNNFEYTVEYMYIL